MAEFSFISISLLMTLLFVPVFKVIVIMQDLHLLFALIVTSVTSFYMTFTTEVMLSFARYLSVPSDKYAPLSD